MENEKRIRVKLIGEPGNSFYILGKVSKAMRRAGVDEDRIKEYIEEATSGDYSHLLATTMKYVVVY